GTSSSLTARLWRQDAIRATGTTGLVRLRDLAAEVLERVRRLLDEGVRLLAGDEDVGAGADGLDAHRPDRIDVALDDVLSPELEPPERGDLAAVLLRAPREAVVDGAGTASLGGAHRRAFVAACATVCWSAKPVRRTKRSPSPLKTSTAGSSSRPSFWASGGDWDSVG